MAKPNYQYEKRQKELAKKRKQEEKRQRKLEKSSLQPQQNEETSTSQPPAEGTTS